MKKIATVICFAVVGSGFCDALRQMPMEYRVKRESLCTRSMNLVKRFSSFIFDAFMHDDEDGEEQSFDEYWSEFDVNVSRLLAETHGIRIKQEIWVPMRSLNPVFYVNASGEGGIVVLNVGRYVSEYFGSNQ